ncbi:MAG: DUF2071 domain-containing protein [Ferruginibacter sp.]|nr:DUF2071 domain-containing protein [Ferruginibacter sp.]
MASKFLTAEWKNLIMANYIVDPAILQPYLPNKTELDFFHDNCYVSLVGFMFMNTRVLGFKIPFHVNFEEVNLRFYVRYNDNGTWKRGTVFIKEIVPKPAISFIANTVYHEKYVTKPMKHTVKETENEMALSYQWKHQNKWNSIQATVENTAQPMIAGSEEEFIAEHYWGYSKYNDTTTFEYNVQHPAWKIFPVKKYSVDCDFGKLYGKIFSFLTNTKPVSILVAEGSAISVLKKRNL